MWLNSFYVVMWCWRSTWPGLGGSGSTGRRRGRAVAEVRAHRHSGPVVPVHEGEIGRAGEHQWVTRMLFVPWIKEEKQRWRLTMVSRGSGGAPAGRGGQKREIQWKCTRVSARRSPRETPGCT
jgi:hypothetical protein